MAESMHTTAEDDDSDKSGKKEPSKRIDSKKLARFPVFQSPSPPTEKPANAAELKRTVEFIPPMFTEARARVTPEAAKIEDDDESSEGEEPKPAQGQAEQPAPEPGEPEAGMYDLSEDMVHLRNPQTHRAVGSEAVQDGQPEEADAVEPPVAPAWTPPPAERPVESGPPAARDGAPPSPPVPPVAFGRFEGPEPTPSPDRAKGEEPLLASTAKSLIREGLMNEVKDVVKEGAQEVLREDMRKIIVAGVIVAILVKDHLATRRKRREAEFNKKIERVNQQAVDLRREQQQTAVNTEEMRRRQEQQQSAMAGQVEALQAAQEGQEQIFDMEGNEIILQPGWRVERSPGGYAFVVDRHNRIVHDAVNYGEAFKRDQKREQLSDDIFAALGAGGPAGGASDGNFVTAPPPDLSQQQSGPRQSLPQLQNHEGAETGHRPAKSKGDGALSALANPWLWTAIALLIIVYFIAALA